MNLEEVEKEIDKINKYLKNCLWMDFELSYSRGKEVIISGSIDMSQNNYAVDIYFEEPFHISSLFFWHTDTQKTFIELVKGSEKLYMNTKYNIEEGNYIFKIYPENYESFIYIIAKKIKCNIINQNPFDFMKNKK
jgi:hypothetical protein